MIRPLLSLKRLYFDETEGKVRYQHSRHGSQEESIDYLEFIARVTSHIPDKGQVMISYYGLYSNAHKGKMRKDGVGSSHPPIIEGEYHLPSKGWAEISRDVTFRIAPLIRRDALEMMDEIRGSRILGAFRGQPAEEKGNTYRPNG